MLGNFSVGDYFKREAIAWAWEFVTRNLGLPAQRLWITIYLDDEEAFHHWREIGIPEERILRFGEADNFWGPAGDSGPCGPCSEIFYDFGEEVGCGKPSCAPNCGCARFTEIWNLVFPQYNQDKEGNRTLLPKPSIDTGMGLERTAAVIQGKTSVYETELFASLIDNISKFIGKNYGSNDEADKAMRIVVEHGRALTFLIADGVMPSNDGRGYVLRRLLRRAQYFGETLARDKPFLVEVVKEVVANMEHIYPEIGQRQGFILEVVKSEVEKFREALLVGRGILNQTLFKMREELAKYFPKFEGAFNEALSKRDILDLRDGVNNAVDHFLRDCRAWEHILGVGGRDAVKEALKPVEDDLGALKKAISDYSGLKPNAFINLKQELQGVFEGIQAGEEAITRELSGYEVFILHDTYGFPVELTSEIAVGRGFSVDLEGFEREMEKQRERAKAAHKFELAEKGRLENKLDVTTVFTGYSNLTQKTEVLSILINNDSVGEVKEGQEANLILQDTPFYGEMGGQVGDTGEIRGPTGRFLVANTIRIPPDIIVHQGRIAEGSFTVGEEVEAEVDRERRLDIARNHTATHLLQAALRQVLGEHIQQRGSLVAPEHLRFDFSHLVAMTSEEIDEVQRIVNDRIRQDLAVYDEDIPYKQAIKEGAIALFDEKYGDVVRVLRVGRPPISAELCGGTHVTTTGEIGFFHIIGESSIGAGLRRIEAVTGRGVERYIAQRLSDLEKIARQLDSEMDEVVDKVSSLSAELKNERKQTQTLERKLAKKDAESREKKVREVRGIKVLAERVAPTGIDNLREMSDLLRDKLGGAVVVLGTIWEDKPAFVANVTPSLVEKGYHAGEIAKRVAKVAGGSGGGKANIAQGGGKNKNKIDEALKEVEKYVEEKSSS